MYPTLEQLHQNYLQKQNHQIDSLSQEGDLQPVKSINRRHEVRNLVLLLITVTTLSFGFINLNLLKIYAKDFFTNQEVEKIHVQYSETQSIVNDKRDTMKKVKQMSSKIENHTKQVQLAQHIVPLMDKSMKQKLNEYKMPFNKLPPQNLLIINNPEFSIITPIVSNFTKTPQQIAKGDFTTELKNGVIQFPGTPNPGEGHSIIAGHSSFNYQIDGKNTFGTIFAKLHKMKVGDTFNIIQNGQMHKYQTIETEIIKPAELENRYQKRDTKNYKSLITLVSCYPPGTTNKRFILTAKEITQGSSHENIYE